MLGHLWTTEPTHKFYLDFGPVTPKQALDAPVELVSSDPNSTPIPLPVTRGQAIFTCTQYRRFSGLFYLETCPAGAETWNEDQPCRPYWTVEPTTARTEKHCLPFDASLGSVWPELVPTKEGMFFTAHQNLKLDDPGMSGLFRVDGDRVRLVVPGVVRHVQVSPNGCRLAFAYAKQLRDTLIGTSGHYSMVAIDICKEKK
jgi:hypothetical protein